MRLVIQRVSEASVTVDGTIVASGGNGLLVLVGLGAGDDAPEAWPAIEAALNKMLVLRIFADESGHMNRSIADIKGDIILVSQFTLYADCKKGRRPSFHQACPPQEAALLYEKICDTVSGVYPGKVESGIFAAHMQVALVNDGPVTIILDTADM